MIGYSTLYKSMNGIKVLSDGVSVISDGQAQHDDIVYNDHIYSEDGKTQITNNKVKTEEIECNDFQADNIMTLTINTNSLQTKYFLVNNNNTDYFKIDAVTNNKLTSNIEMDLYEPLNIINKDIHQTQTGRIYQQGTNNNYLKDTYINGYLQIGSNLTQSGGSSSLKDLTVDNLTLRENKGISQTGTNVSNTLAGTTTTKDLIILNSVVFPSSVTVPGTTTTDDIVMEGNSVITQDLTTTTTKKNIFRNTKTLDLEIDGNISQIKGGATAIFKNTTIQGTAEIQGDITQTSGTTVIKTLRCNNITLNDDQIITQSGTGYLIQSGTGQNILKEISLLSNANLIFNGAGIISQPLNGINIFSHFRSAGFGIIGGRNNTTYTNYQNIQNNNGLQFQFNRDNSTQYSFIMNNRGTGGNGGFRFQRYIGGVYLDEPLVIDDNITMNKNVSIPAGSLSCSSATIGNISQSELNCLDNCSQNINDKFISLDSQIASIQSTGSNNSTALTGITYTSGSDTTNIDNNVTISSGKNLTVGNTNIITAINSINNTLSGISYDSTQDITTINNHVLLPTGNNFFLGSGYNVKTNIDDCINKLSGITYASGTDTTTIDNNVTINKTLIVQGMNIKAEIDALDTSFTTGTINSTDLTTSNLYVNNTAKFGEVGGTTYIKNDMRFCNITNKSEGEFTQVYQGGSQFNILNHRPSGNISFQIKNSGDTALVEYMKLNSTSLNVKNTNVDIDTNLNVDGTTTLNGATTINNTLNVNNRATLNSLLVNYDTYLMNTNTNNISINQSVGVPNIFTTCTNFVTNSDLSEKQTTTSTPNTDIATLTLSQPFSKSINMTIALSGGMTFKTSGLEGTSNRLQYSYSYTSLNVSLYKNGYLWKSNIAYENPQGQDSLHISVFLNGTFRMSYISTANFLKYYLGTIKFSFVPDAQFVGETNVYSVRITFNVSYTLQNYNDDTNVTTAFDNKLLVYFNPSMFASVVYSYNSSGSLILEKCGSTMTFINHPVANGYTGPTSISVDNSYVRNLLDFSTPNELQINNCNINSAYISSAKINSIIDTDITKASIKNITNYVKQKSTTAGYMFNGGSGSPKVVTPIVCSISIFSPADRDDYYLINPGYKFECYYLDNYKGTKQEYANDSNDPYFWSIPTSNQTNSIKVFYRNNTSESWQEISYSPISDVPQN